MWDDYKNELLELLTEAQDDVNHGRVAPIQDTFQDIRAILKGFTLVTKPETEFSKHITSFNRQEDVSMRAKSVKDKE